MSKETSAWLNQNVLIGMTDQRGKAWHYRSSDQGDEPNHYSGAIPVGDVHRRLFDWTAEEHPLYLPATYADGGESPLTFRQIPGRKAIVRSDTGETMGIFKDGYVPHQYGEWLIHNVANILDDDLAVSSAGLLRNGAVAWVEVSVPDTITTSAGVSYRPNLVATTSFDGSMATTYAPTITATVCDNTLTAALAGAHIKKKIRHSVNSMGQYADVRSALDIVHTVSEEFDRELQELLHTKVDNPTFEEIVDRLDPMPKPEDKPSPNKITIAEKKRESVWNLWLRDPRVSPWHGTAFGAWQAYNTYQHHESVVRGANRAERNALNTLTGKTEKDDAEVLDAILAVTG